MTSVKALLALEPKEDPTPVQCQGWLRSKRDSKGGFSFLELNDGSCFQSIQVIADQNLPNYTDEIQPLTTGCSIIVNGNLVSTKGRKQSQEIQATGIQVLGTVDDPQTYPVAKKRHTFEFLREVAHLRPRTNTFSAMTRIRHCAAFAIHRFFNEQGFCWVNTPIITASDCEGAGELFRVTTLDPTNPSPKSFEEDFFATATYLTVSGQLQVESFCMAMSKVYTFGPTFRAENSNTSRHLAEFWMIEPEIAFADLTDVVDLAEAFLKAVATAVLNECEDDLAFFQSRIDKTCIDRLKQMVDDSFERIDYSDAIKMLQDSKTTFEFPVKWGLDLQSEHERYLTEQVLKKPAAVLNYPASIKAFYMRENPDGRTCAAMDILAPGIGEIIGGSQREERLDMLDKKMEQQGLAEHLGWYRDLRRYGTVPHGGFGLGFERLLSYLTGMENVRDTIPFPRTPNSASF